MKLQCIATLALAIAGTPVLAGEHPILPLVLNDGVYFDAGEFDGGMDLRVAGPDDFYYKGSAGKGESMFVDITNLGGAALADGLYIYEVSQTPARLVNREHMTQAEQAVHKRRYGRGLPAISGSFRVVNGAIIDPGLEE